MLDLKFIENNEEVVRKALVARGMDDEYLDKVIRLANVRRKYITGLEKLRADHNKNNEKIAEAKREGRDASAFLSRAKQLSADIKGYETNREVYEAELENALLYIPNIPHESVPEGPDENYNEIRRKSKTKPRNFDFTPRPHWEIGEMLRIIDQERAVKIAGSRFTMTVGAGARLERALQNLMLDEASKREYTEVLVPFMVLGSSMVGTGQLPKFDSDMYKVEGYEFAEVFREFSSEMTQDRLPVDYMAAFGKLNIAREGGLWLIPTAEVPVTNLHREEILAADELPKKYAAFTPCFRREAGAPGRDTRGMIRVHQFLKVELVKVVHPETSYDELESLVDDARNVLKLLELPYREAVLSTGDLGFGAAKCVDLEVWIPSEEKYREISSCSNYEAFQARRMNTRFRPAKGAKPEFVHTLNGSGLAIGRTLVAILENFQNADGSVTIPDALRPYMDGLEKIA